MTGACRLAAFVLLAALVGCAVASAAGWHRAVAGPGGTVAFVALAGCLVRLRLRGGRQ